MSNDPKTRHGLDTEIEVTPEEARRSVAPKQRLRKLAETHGYRPLLYGGVAVLAMPWAPFPPCRKSCFSATSSTGFLRTASFPAHIPFGSLPTAQAR